MERINNGPVRKGWPTIIEQEGLVYWKTELPDGNVRSYWREGQYYAFTAAEIEQMHTDAQTIFEMLVAAGDYLIANPELMLKMGIPAYTHAQIKASWDRGEVDWGSVYGRYDVVFGGANHPDEAYRRIRLFEFNADTPTSLPESAINQWSYLEFLHSSGQPRLDQWNRVYDDLVDAWKRNMGHIEAALGHKPVVYFVCSMEDDSGEDVKNLLTLRETCTDAGYETKVMFIDDIFISSDGRFYDSSGGNHMDVVFKLYPWEMMVREPFGEAAFKDMATVGKRSATDSVYTGGTIWIEPPYKMLWSNKGILAILWKLFGNDPERSKLLIPSYFADEKPEDMANYVKKPLLSREGANVTVTVEGQTVLQTDGQYGAEGYVCQTYVPAPNFPFVDEDGTENNYPVLGIWMIDGAPSGLGIRESQGPVTDNLSCFAPHVILDSSAQPNENEGQMAAAA